MSAPLADATGGSIFVLTPWSVLWSMSGGGGTTVGVKALDSLLAAGYTIDVIAPRGAGEGFGSVEGLRVHEVSPARLRSAMPVLRTLGWLELNARLLAGALRAARRVGRPRVVYGFSALATPALVATGFWLRRPTIAKLFGTFLYPGLGRPLSLGRHLPEVVAFKAPVTCLQVLDDGTRGDRVAARLHVPPARLRFWRHGVDWSEIAAARSAVGVRAELSLEDDVPLLVSSSRLVDWKRVDRIIRALPRVRERHPSVVLAIAGSGPEQPALERLAAQLGVSAATRFLGSLPRAQNLRLTAAADVFCSFYDYSNLGVSLIEAMALGVACVVTDTGATAEVVEDGISGLVVAPEDDQAADVIATLLDDADRRQILAAGATDRIRSVYPTAAERAQWELDLVAELNSPRRRDAHD